MKIGFVFVLYKTPKSEIERLKREIKKLKIKNYQIYFIDNSFNNKGYAAGVNKGLKKAIKDDCHLFVVANPDISLKNLNKKNKKLFDGLRYFDILGLAIKQEGKKYYGGRIDKWRMSGGLIENKPKRRFQSSDFVSGSLMIIKKSVIDKIGFFDESYFLYYEEVDFCYRAKKVGFKIGIDRDFIYEHFEVSKENQKKDYFLFKNRFKFFLKYSNFNQKIREFIRLPKTIFEEIAKRPFYLNFFSLNFSSIINKALNFILFIILIRYFKPEDYAVYTLAWTHIGLLLPILDFGTTSYGLVNLSISDNKQISSLFSFRIILSIFTFILTNLLGYFFGYGKEILLPIMLTSFVIFANTLSGTFLILVSIANKSYLASLITMIFQTILIVSLITGVILTKKLITVFILTFILYNIYSIFNFLLLKKQVKDFKFKFDFFSWLKIGKKSIVFLMISLLAGIYSKVDVLLLNFLKGKSAVGIYSSGYRFLDALMFMVSAYNISSMPIFSNLVKEKNKKMFLDKIKKDLFLVLGISGLIAVSIFIFSPYVLPLFLKGDYKEAILPLRIIIFSLPLILMTSIALNGLYSLNKAKWVVYLFFFILLYNFFGNYIFIPIYSYLGSSFVSLIGEILNVLISFIILKKAINENFG